MTRTYWMKYLDGKVIRIWGCDAETANQAADMCKAQNGVNPIWSSISAKYPR